ncbi:MAG: cytochrome c [Pirellulaceae bacterium]
MTSWRVNVLLAALLVVAVALVGSLQTDLSQPNWQLFRAMKHSPASQAFEVNMHFANQRTQQPPVAGTIPRGLLPLHFAATPADAVRAGEEILNPYRVAIAKAALSPALAENTPRTSPASGEIAKTEESPDRVAARELEASARRGAEVFNVHCVACHGASGKGDGLVAQRGFPPPPPLPTGKSIQMKDGQLFHILTWGQGSMASMASQLTRGQRWDVVNFVRTLQAPADGANTAAPPSAPSQP